MKFDPSTWNAAAETRDNLRRVAIGVVTLVCLAAWVLFMGRSVRAVYLGTDPAFSITESARLRTNPDANYVMPRNSEFYALKVGCRYDFVYEAAFGRRQRPDRPRQVRSATLVDCP